MSLLGVDSSEEHQAVLRSLGNGECIFRDLDGRAGRIVVDLISDDLRRWLDTNPTRATSAQVPVSESAAGRGQGGAAGRIRDGRRWPACRRHTRASPVAANGQQSARGRPPSPVQAPAPRSGASDPRPPTPGAPLMFTIRRAPRKAAIALVLLAVLFGLLRGAAHAGQAPGAHLPAALARWQRPGPPVPEAARPRAPPRRWRRQERPGPSRRPRAARPADLARCPASATSAGLLGFCSLGQSGIIGGLEQPLPARRAGARVGHDRRQRADQAAGGGRASRSRPRTTSTEWPGSTGRRRTCSART